jgi:hypothetical protein
VKYCPRLPMLVEPAARTAAVFSTEAGVPMTKSPKWGATGAPWVRAAKSSGDSKIRPVPRGMSAR